MLAKLTNSNQVVLPQSVTQAIGPVEYFEVSVKEGQIILTPVQMRRADAVREKLAELCIRAQDVADAIA